MKHKFPCVVAWALLVWGAGGAWAQVGSEPPARQPTPVPAMDTPLRDDPRLVSGALENGLRYRVMRHDRPPGRAVVWLHVSSGSLNEKDEERGLAHYLEHMAFNGSTNFPPGSVVPYFESLGMTFGRDQNAFTTFDQTTYQLTLPNVEPGTLDKAMLFLSDVALRLTLSDEEIDKERKIILEERRRGMSGERRVSDSILERIAPGSIVGLRLPIGDEDRVSAFTRPDFVAYYSRWYVPSNMTVLAVADTDPALVVGAITRAFAEGRTGAPPAGQDAGVRPTEGVRAIVAQDKDLRRATVGITRVWPGEGPVATVGGFREHLVRRLGLQAFNRRLADKRARGLLTSLEGSARLGSVGRAMARADVTFAGETDAWREMLVEAAGELQRARVHGFTARELGDVRSQVAATARQSALTERTRPAAGYIGLLNEAVTAGEPLLSAAQEYELGTALLPTITDAEVSARFGALFDPSGVVLVATLPTSAGEVSEKEVLEIGVKALGVVPPAQTDEPRAGALLAHLPEPGEIVETADHVGASVTSVWLSNGVRVHFRHMDYRNDSVTVSVLLAGGELLDTPATKGLARAASVGWMQPATGTLSNSDIKGLLTGKNLAVVGRAESDAMVITVSGSPDRIETGLQLAHLMLTDPKIEAPAFEQWVRRTLQAIERAGQDCVGGAARLLPETVYPPGEVRPLLLTAEQVNALKIGDAQAWLLKTIASSPIEVSVVGDIDKARAMELAALYFGSLPARERIGPGTFKGLREIAPPQGPKSARREVVTATPKASVVCGFFGPDAWNLDDRRLVSLASRILSARLVKELREEKQLVYTIGARADPGQVYPGYGLVSAQATADPANAEALADAIDAVFGAFAKDGPTPEELAGALKQVQNDLSKQLLEPSFWSDRLRDLTYRAQSLDDIMSGPEAFASFTAEQITGAFARYYSPARTVRVVVVPAPGK